ncbi:MAG: fibronectin type III domain-containing protein [Planctomycetes bacterium]|nr:fibronectin type III domain-containing protein [Planctomycetota bacterium]
MPQFPRTEAEVVALVEQMIAGYTAHPGDFPSIDPLVQLVALQTALNEYQTDKNTQEDTHAQAKLATVTKDTKLDGLVETMKNDLKLSEVDTVDDPEKLAQIGWGPKSAPQPIESPGQPENFRPTVEGSGDIWLAWSKPASGGQVRNYILQKRQQPAGGGEFGAWEVVGSALDTEIHLTEQSRGLQLEYRVIAANIAGESMPSNTAAVVL